MVSAFNIERFEYVHSALLSEQFHLTIIIWLMSVIPFASCLMTITIGYQDGLIFSVNVYKMFFCRKYSSFS